MRRLAVFVLFVLSGDVLATTDIAFDNGVFAFKNNNYDIAIAWFEKAREQGNDSPVLVYNLAISYYKLGRMDEARRYFEETVQDQYLAGLSHYNLGLIALKDEDEPAARSAFLKSLETTDDEDLKLLAEVRLDELDQEAQDEVVFHDISGFFSISAAVDDNVNRINDDLPTVVNAPEDSYLDLYGMLGYQLSGKRDQGVQLKGGLVLTRYSELSFYDENVMNFGIHFSRQVKGWRVHTGIDYAHDSLDGEAFQERFALLLRVDNDYAENQRLRFKYDLVGHNDLEPVYSYLSGTKQRFTLDNQSRWDRHKLRLGYQFEFNNRNNLVTTDSFSSYSPTRHRLYSMYEYGFNRHWLGQALVDYRNSNYENANISAGVAQGVRKENRRHFGLTITHRYDHEIEFEAKWRHTINRSNYDSENYTSSLLMLSVNRFF